MKTHHKKILNENETIFNKNKRKFKKLKKVKILIRNKFNILNLVKVSLKHLHRNKIQKELDTLNLIAAQMTQVDK